LEIWALETLCSGRGMILGRISVPVAALANPFRLYDLARNSTMRPATPRGAAIESDCAGQ
jgi:hypothetical protein